MKSKIVILSVVGLTAGVFGSVGSRILAGPDTASPAGDRAPIARSAGSTGGRADACRGLARRVSGGAISDAQLKRLLKRHGDCPAVVVDTRTPTFPAPASGPQLSIGSPSEDEDDDFGEDEYEDDDDGEDGMDFENEDEED
jgi:hypothetical protein